VAAFTVRLCCLASHAVWAHFDQSEAAALPAPQQQQHVFFQTCVPSGLLVPAQAAGLKHIGFGPFKRENQDEFFIQVGDFGGVPGGNLFCVFDGHGTYGKDAALYSRQLLPRMLDVELRKYFTVCWA
jgi:hypothetical protein